MPPRGTKKATEMGVAGPTMIRVNVRHPLMEISLVRPQSFWRDRDDERVEAHKDMLRAGDLLFLFS